MIFNFFNENDKKWWVPAQNKDEWRKLSCEFVQQYPPQLIFHMGDGTSCLYTLIAKPNNTVRVEVSHDQFYEGNMIDDWEFLKSNTMTDIENKKPSEWVTLR